VRQNAARSTLATRLAVVATVAVLLAGAPALAETGDDSGIPLGQLIVKPALTVEAIYDSNVYRQQQDPQADLGIQAIPSIRLIYPGDNFRWELDAYYRFFTYFNVAGKRHDALRDVANFQIGTLFDANRQGKVGFWFNPVFFNRRGMRGADTDSSQGSDLAYELGVSTPLELRFRPTNAFSLNVDAAWHYVRAYHMSAAFDPDPTILGQSHDVGGGVNMDWRFFPRSHFLFDGDVGHVFQGPFDSGAALHDSPAENTYFRVSVGLRGDVTRKLSMMGMIGYGNVFLGEALRDQNLTGVEGIIGRAEIALRPVLTQRLAIGFYRDFHFRYFTYHITDTQAYFKYKGLIAGRLAILANFTYTYRNLAGADGGSDGIPRTEHQWGAGAGVEVMVAEWFHILAGYRFNAVNPSSNNVGEYIDNRVNLGITLGFR
jgi:hypothetical protein